MKLLLVSAACVAAACVADAFQPVDFSELTLWQGGESVFWQGAVDAGWSRFPGGQQLVWHSPVGLPMVFTAFEHGEHHQMRALLPGRAFLDANLEMTGSARVIWGDNLLWGGGGDLIYNGEHVQLAGRAVGIGTAAPAVALDVRGDVRISGAVELSGPLRLAPAGRVPMGRFTNGVDPRKARTAPSTGGAK
jgi:hypothetical protein